MLPILQQHKTITLSMVFSLLIWAAGGVLLTDKPARQSYIIQGQELTTLKAAVQAVGGEITHELGIINAVAASLDADQIESLRNQTGISLVMENAQVETAGLVEGGSPYTHYPTVVGADRLHDDGIYGSGVTVAVLDSGFPLYPATNRGIYDQTRKLKLYQAITDVEGKALDKYGHGSHVTSIAISSDFTGGADPDYNGIAPDAQVVGIKAFDKFGKGSYASVIRGMDWIYNNKDVYDIRVVNMSFSAEPRSHYWDDPLNQAAMRLWEAGIVVVASAGNTGPDPMSIGVPGNLPYIITVGAMSDNYSPLDPTDDVIASFSSAGPTVEGFVKPEIVAPGGHMRGLSRPTSKLATLHPAFHDQDNHADFRIMPNR